MTTDTPERPVMLRPIDNRQSIARRRLTTNPRHIQWQDLAEQTQDDASALAALVEARRAYNPASEAAVWENARHWAAGATGGIVSAAAGLVLGAVEAAGLALIHTVARHPTIAFPVLVFVVSLEMQTLSFDGQLDLSAATVFIQRAGWVAGITALAVITCVGVYQHCATRKREGDAILN